MAKALWQRRWSSSRHQRRDPHPAMARRSYIDDPWPQPSRWSHAPPHPRLPRPLPKVPSWHSNSTGRQTQTSYPGPHSRWSQIRGPHSARCCFAPCRQLQRHLCEPFGFWFNLSSVICVCVVPPGSAFPIRGVVMQSLWNSKNYIIQSTWSTNYHQFMAPIHRPVAPMLPIPI